MTERKHVRKTFATPTLRLINSRAQYYRRILQQPLSDNASEKQIRKRQKLQQKYERDMKVRTLLNRAVGHLYGR